MDKQLQQETLRALADFVIRVSKGETTSAAEVAILPKVAEVLLNYFTNEN